MIYNFEWDPKKAKANLQKHEISFERATEIFLDPSMLSVFDEQRSENEDRWITIGKDRSAITLVVVHTFRDIDSEQSAMRIISARRATKKEERQYTAR